VKFTKSGNYFVIRLIKGEEIVEELVNFCSQNAVKSGYFSAIGAVDSAKIGFYDLNKKEFNFKNFNKPYEIASLIGNISQVDGRPFLHIHTVLSDENFTCIGGHLEEAVVGATCEVYLVDLGMNIERKYDNGIGLKLLDFQ